MYNNQPPRIAPQDGNVLVWDDTAKQWVPKDPSGVYFGVPKITPKNAPIAIHLDAVPTAADTAVNLNVLGGPLLAPGNLVIYYGEDGTVEDQSIALTAGMTGPQIAQAIVAGWSNAGGTTSTATSLNGIVTITPSTGATIDRFSLDTPSLDTVNGYGTFTPIPPGGTAPGGTGGGVVPPSTGTVGGGSAVIHSVFLKDVSTKVAPLISSGGNTQLFTNRWSFTDPATDTTDFPTIYDATTTEFQLLKAGTVYLWHLQCEAIYAETISRTDDANLPFEIELRSADGRPGLTKLASFIGYLRDDKEGGLSQTSLVIVPGGIPNGKVKFNINVPRLPSGKHAQFFNFEMRIMTLQEVT